MRLYVLCSKCKWFEFISLVREKEGKKIKAKDVADQGIQLKQTQNYHKRKHGNKERGKIDFTKIICFNE